MTYPRNNVASNISPNTSRLALMSPTITKHNPADYPSRRFADFDVTEFNYISVSAQVEYADALQRELEEVRAEGERKDVELD
jgi:hypothetical protein